MICKVCEKNVKDAVQVGIMCGINEPSEPVYYCDPCLHKHRLLGYKIWKLLRPRNRYRFQWPAKEIDVIAALIDVSMNAGIVTVEIGCQTRMDFPPDKVVISDLAGRIIFRHQEEQSSQ